MIVSINTLKNGRNYPKEPDSINTIEAFDAIKSSLFSGQRVRGWFIAPLTGNYTFYSSCQDFCELYISKNNGSINATLIINQTQRSSGNYQWNIYPSQTSVPVFLTANSSYYMEALTFCAYKPNSLSIGAKFPNDQDSKPIENKYLMLLNFSKSGLLQEAYTTSTSMPLHVLRYNENFPKKPFSTEIISTFAGPRDYAEYYGRRIRGWFHAPLTGFYTFYSNCDDFCELYLSEDNDPVNNNLLIRQSFSSAYGSWNTYTTQTSDMVFLNANQSYYIEGLMMDTFSADHFNIGVKLPSNLLDRPISSKLLSPIKIDYTCSTQNCTITKSEKCVFENGSYAICTCQNGYSLINNVCQDINECADESNACSSNKSRCFNTEGSYKCCDECWILGADGQICNDVDESLPHCKTHLGLNYRGELKGTSLTLSLQAFHTNLSSQYAYNVTIEYYLPPFTFLSAEIAALGLVKNGKNVLKYFYNGAFALNETINHNISLNVIISQFVKSEMFNLDVPVKLWFKNAAGKERSMFKVYRIKPDINATKAPKTPKVLFALPESYGRGIYWDSTNSHIYVCMNQHVASTNAACYYSNNQGEKWAEMDLIVGSIIGHHRFTKQLYAIHRNHKTYLMFRKDYKKWFMLTNDEFVQKAAMSIDFSFLRSLEDDDEQIFNLGSHQWIGNFKGLFFKDPLSDKLLPRVLWPI